jgi:hypothetical protein
MLFWVSALTTESACFSEMLVSAYESTRSRRPEIQCRHPQRRENLKSQCRHVTLLFSDAVTTDGMYRRMTHGRVIVNNESRVVCKGAIVVSATWIVRKQRVKVQTAFRGFVQGAVADYCLQLPNKTSWSSDWHSWSYSGGTGLKSRPGDPLSDWGSVVFYTPSTQMLE